MTSHTFFLPTIQKTPKDKKASLVIHGFVDKVPIFLLTSAKVILPVICPPPPLPLFSFEINFTWTSCCCTRWYIEGNGYLLSYSFFFFSCYVIFKIY